MVAGEYPPTLGGIGDYTRILARELCAAGDDIRLFVPDGSKVGGGDAAIAGTFPKWSWRTLPYLLDVLAETDASVVHVQHNASMYRSHCASYYFPRYLRGKGWPGRVAVTFHDINLPSLLPRGGRLWAGMARHWVLGDLARQADVSIAADSVDVESLASLGGRVAQVPIGSNMHGGDGNPADGSHVRARYGVPPGNTLVGHFGTPLGLDVVMESLATLSDVTLLLIGKQQEMHNRSNIEKLTPRVHDSIARYRVGDRLRWTGHLPRQDVVNAMAGCDMVVLPYPAGASMRHGGLVAALTQGKAVITTSPQAKMLGLENGVTHMEVPTGDAAALGAAIHRLASDLDWRHHLEAGAVKAAADYYSWSAIVARHREIYRGDQGLSMNLAAAAAGVRA
jgi:glycosyltransferase involved in cell wall biosynthesis